MCAECTTGLLVIASDSGAGRVTRRTQKVVIEQHKLKDEGQGLEATAKNVRLLPARGRCGGRVRPPRAAAKVAPK